MSCQGFTNNGTLCKRKGKAVKDGYCCQHTPLVLRDPSTVVKTLAVEGTHQMGFVSGLSYATLVGKFGEPHDTDVDGKIKALWMLMDPTTQSVFTIYDWKQYDTRKEKITSWDIGGYDSLDISVVSGFLGKRVKPIK